MSGANIQPPKRHRDLCFRARSRQVQSEARPLIVHQRDTRWSASNTVVVVCDLWDRHWCGSATSRLQELAPRVNHFLGFVRQQGSLILHCPSGVLKFYRQHPARLRAQQALNGRPSQPEPPNWWKRDPAQEPHLPIDVSDDDCPCTPACRPAKVFTRQSAAVSIAATDVISTDEHEIRALFEQHAIQHVLILGVHLNMCLLGRPFGIRRWVLLDQEVVLVRDLTDVLYDPRRHPFVSIEEAQNLVVAHVETYLCPSVTSADIACATQQKGAGYI